MKILIIDGQGGKFGKEIVGLVTERFPKLELIAIGTNSIATATMIKAGAPHGATGENPLIVACRTADIIVGPIGIVIADSLLGEVTPAMALAVAQSNAKRILIPMNKCDNLIAGINGVPTGKLIEDVAVKIDEIIKECPCKEEPKHILV